MLRVSLELDFPPKEEDGDREKYDENDESFSGGITQDDVASMIKAKNQQLSCLNQIVSRIEMMFTQTMKKIVEDREHVNQQ